LCYEKINVNVSRMQPVTANEPAGAITRDFLCRRLARLHQEQHDLLFGRASPRPLDLKLLILLNCQIAYAAAEMRRLDTTPTDDLPVIRCAPCPSLPRRAIRCGLAASALRAAFGNLLAWIMLFAMFMLIAWIG
jgi:hypothetical protein